MDDDNATAAAKQFEEQVAQITADLKKSYTCAQAKRFVKIALVKNKQNIDSWKDVSQLVEMLGLGTKLRNQAFTIHQQMQQKPPTITAPMDFPVHIDRLDYVERAKVKWEKRIRLEINSMAAEFGMPLMRQARFAADGTRIHQEPASAVRFVYDENDFLEVVASIVNPNHSSSVTKIMGWGMIKLETSTETLEQMQQRFPELDPSVRQLGADDEIGGVSLNKTPFYEERIRQSQRVMEQGFIPHLRQFAKKGIPHSERPKIWQRLLNIDPKEQESPAFEALKSSIDQVDLVTDDLFRLDVTMTCNDDDFFVFEELLEEVMLMFSRDKWVAQNSTLSSQRAAAAADASQPEIFPPCGVVPFRGLALYATPLCYLYDRPEEMYSTFRHMYVRYFCRSSVVSSEPDSVMQLCHHFEVLVQSQMPNVFYHMIHLKIPPLKLAFSWIMFAFVGQLELEQLLLLWDRILAYDTLALVPLAAAAIFWFKAKAILECTSAEEVTDLFEDKSRIRIIPLLQMFLYNDRFEPPPIPV